MQYNPELHHRRSIRLQHYDYSQSGAYFVTICTKDKECLFGEIRDGEMRLNEAGEMVLQVWNELPVHYRHIELDEFVIMPNHVHGIVMLNDVGAGPSACPVANEKTHPLSKDRQPPSMDGQPRGVAPTRLSLSDIVHRFKSFTTAQYRRGVSQFHCLPFKGKLWQRNYYEHIIRNEIELKKIREYIVNNPLNCMEDENYINL